MDISVSPGCFPGEKPWVAVRLRRRFDPSAVVYTLMVLPLAVKGAGSCLAAFVPAAARGGQVARTASSATAANGSRFILGVPLRISSSVAPVEPRPRLHVVAIHRRHAEALTVEDS